MTARPVLLRLAQGAAVAGITAAGWLCLAGTASAVEVTPPAVIQEAALTTTDSAGASAREVTSPVTAPQAPAAGVAATAQPVKAEVARTTHGVAAVVKKAPKPAKAEATDTTGAVTRITTSATTSIRRSARPVAQDAPAAVNQIASAPLGTEVLGQGHTLDDAVVAITTTADTALREAEATVGVVDQTLAAARRAVEVLRNELLAVGSAATMLSSPRSARYAESVAAATGGSGASASFSPVLVAGSATAAPTASPASPRHVEGVVGGSRGLPDLSRMAGAASTARMLHGTSPPAPADPAPGSPLTAALAATVGAMLSASGQLGGAAGVLAFLIFFGLFGSVLVRASAVRVIRPEGAEPPVSPA